MYTYILMGLAFGIITLNAHFSFAQSTTPDFAVGIGFDVSSGSYGTNSTSTFVSAPLIIDWFPTERLDMELTLPFVYQKSSSGSHLAENSTVAKSAARGPMAGSGTGRMVGSGGGLGGGAGSGVGSGKGSGGMLNGDYGLGYITFTGGYTLLIENGYLPQLRPTLYLKFPTADESAGLGTGKFDYGAGFAASKWLGNWQPFAEGRYVIQGATETDGGAENFITADVGAGYSWNERFMTSVYMRLGSTMFEGMSAPVEGRLKMVWRIAEKTYTDIYALKGFSDGSPDYGGGASIFMEF